MAIRLGSAGRGGTGVNMIGVFSNTIDCSSISDRVSVSGIILEGSNYFPANLTGEESPRQ